jgi:hypothetical protein
MDALETFASHGRLESVILGGKCSRLKILLPGCGPDLISLKSKTLDEDHLLGE